MMDREKLYIQMSEAVVKFEEERVAELAEKSLEMGLDPVETILHALSAGMLIVGDLFEKKEYFVPEILMCAEAMQAGLDILQARIPKGSTGNKGRIVIGTVFGDVHDIGKNIVKLMLEVGGYTVYDLGRDVPLEKFVEEVNRTNADIVAMSAMLTTTMMGMKKVIEMIRESNPRVRVMIGGAPVSAEVVKRFGADGYAKTAGTVLEEAEKLFKRIKQDA
ncbi:MAG: corrinoid protein [Syntrophales bacterium]|nr:corrinoid protein [Syntrophales bacterium]